MNIGLILVIIILVILVIYILVTYNDFIKLRNKVNESFATMDVYLKKRWDLVPNLIEVVKGYVKHEDETLEKLVKLRNSSYDNINGSDKLELNNELSNNLGKLFAIVENYPDLKASSNFQELSKELAKVEEDIASSRRYYNGSVRLMNDKVQMFPSNIVAKLFGFKVLKMFEINEEERENVKVKF